MTATETGGDRFLQTACGRVSITAPGAGETYWRLAYTLHGKRQQTTGGRSRESALAKAHQIVAMLDAGTTRVSDTRVEVALDAYLLWNRQEHAANTSQKDEPDLRKAFAGFGRLRCSELDRVVLGKALERSTTPTAAQHRRSRLSRFLKWGYEKGYFRQLQTHLTDHLTWTAKPGLVLPPSRNFQPPQVDEADRYVTPDQVPSHKAIDRLGNGMGALSRWGKLCVELTYTTGVRSGEMYALEASNVDLDEFEIAVNWQILSLSGLATRQSRPKYGRPRGTNYPEVTLTGYPIAKALAARVAEARAEQEAGTNPRGLLFPAQKGGWHWASGFGRTYFTPAAETAGWDRIGWTNETGDQEHLWVHTMHSLRHRFARDRIDTYDHTIAELQAVGGWRSGQVVWERYYGQDGNLLKSSGVKMRTQR